ncbi:hypothetical protein NQZ68_008038 [Dissostichus eleginoides]|nr:hypothetical protein NQZ68_008038 [Dissostichus eleginoides]
MALDGSDGMQYTTERPFIRMLRQQLTETSGGGANKEEGVWSGVGAHSHRQDRALAPASANQSDRLTHMNPLSLRRCLGPLCLAPGDQRHMADLGTITQDKCSTRREMLSRSLSPYQSKHVLEKMVLPKSINISIQLTTAQNLQGLHVPLVVRKNIHLLHNRPRFPIKSHEELPCITKCASLQHRERKLRGTMREWMFGTGPICPCPVPQSHGPGQTRQSPAGHGQLTHRGLDGKKQDALIKPMLFVNFLCMDAIIAVCQRVVSHAS